MREHEKKIYEEKIRFLINISHELRTPLTLIYASLKRILNKEVKQDELPEYLQGAFKQANQMKDIINIVLDARKMEVGQDRKCYTSLRILYTSGYRKWQKHFKLHLKPKKLKLHTTLTTVYNLSRMMTLNAKLFFPI